MEMNGESPGDSPPSDRKWYYRLICYKGGGRSSEDTEKRVTFIIEKWLERYTLSLDAEEESKKEDGEEDKREEDKREEDNEEDDDKEEDNQVEDAEEINQKEGEDDEMKAEEACHTTDHLPSTSIGSPNTSTAREPGRRTVDFAELPTNSAKHSHEIMQGQRKPLRSIIKTSDSLLTSHRSAVTFENVKEDTSLNSEGGRKVISPREEEESNDEDFFDKCRKFCSKPACKIITCITFGILLPTFLIYPGLFYLYELSSSQKVVEEEPS